MTVVERSGDSTAPPPASRRHGPKVSAIVPAYNVAAYLPRALDSALAQTLADLEVIVVDDGSTDETAAIAAAYAARDGRVRVLRNDGNQGVSASRNRALAAAQGEWVALLDADDAWLPERLERLLGAAEAVRADVVSDDTYRVSPDGRMAWSSLRHRWYPPLVIRQPRWLSTADLVHHHLGVLKPVFCRVYVRRQRFRFDPTLGIYEDFLFFLDVSLSGARWLQVPEGYYLYHTRQGSLTTETPMLRQGEAVFRAFEALLLRSEVQANPVLRLSIERFLHEERISVLFDRVRVAVRTRRPDALARVLLAGTVDLPDLCRQAAYRIWVRGSRDLRGAKFPLPPLTVATASSAISTAPPPASRRHGPKVSAIVPAYNVAAYLPRALDSALAQTLADLEVIVVDDGSTDETAAIAAAYAARDGRVRVLRNDGNQGVSASRNRALAAAQGEWVALLDADDAWLPERLERLLGAAEAVRADVVSDDTYRVSPDGRMAWSSLHDLWYGRLLVREPRWLTAVDLVQHRLGVLQPLARRAFLLERSIRCRTELTVYEDFLSYLEMLLAGARWLQVPEGYYLYYVRPGSLTTTSPMLRRGEAVFRAFEALFERSAVSENPELRRSLERFISQERVNVLFDAVRSDLSHGRPGHALLALGRHPAALGMVVRELIRRVHIHSVRLRERISLAGPIGSMALPQVAEPSTGLHAGRAAAAGQEALVR